MSQPDALHDDAGSRASASLLVVTGMSGGGKSVALHTFEDLGFFCVDNLPAELLPEFVRTAVHPDRAEQKLAVGIDMRNRGDLANLPEWLSAVGAMGLEPKLVFFDATDASLIKRYAETRRRHPLTHLGLALADAIALERQALKPLLSLADVVVDTTELNVHQLRRRVITELGLTLDNELSLLFESFAYRRGVPADADFVFDARSLPNPHWDPRLKPLSGRDADVKAYLGDQPDVREYLAQVTGFLDTWLPRMQSDTRSYVTVAFGCTGGRHRSVYLAEALAEHARERGWTEVATFHRELD
ncbi:MAG TPA: RNase adapter RapZ [Luteimonas sp.]|nr:RNase adapter RapZ [Luteimonas sp.]HRO26068.1 RNase adapter RapZ [Luteimonas sp.]HRP71618.1 RNase adapter RapZ [Luteimonas sp.]